jgi:hypothetical protein
MRSYFIQLDLDGRAEYIWNSVSILDLMNRGISRPNDQVKCCLTTLGSRPIVEVGECYNPKRICTWEFVRSFYGSSGKSLPSSIAGSSAMARMLGSIIPGSEYHAIPYRVGLLLSDLVVLWNANTHFRYCGGGSTTILEEKWFGTILFAMTCFILRLAQWVLGVQVTIEMNNPSWTLLLLWISILVIPPLVILALRVYFRARSSFTRLQSDPAGRVLGSWVPAPWVGSASLIGPHGWVLNISGYPTHRWVPNGSWVLAWVLGPGS